MHLGTGPSRDTSIKILGGKGGGQKQNLGGGEVKKSALEESKNFYAEIFKFGQIWTHL